MRCFAADALDLIHAYRFPGNVRELRNGVERGVAYAQGSELRARDLPRRLRSGLNQQPASPGAAQDLFPGTGAHMPSLEEMERRYIRHVLDTYKGNKQRAAAHLGIGRRTLYRELGMEREP